MLYLKLHPYSCKSLARKKAKLVRTSWELIIVTVVSKEATAVRREEASYRRKW